MLFLSAQTNRNNGRCRHCYIQYANQDTVQAQYAVRFAERNQPFMVLKYFLIFFLLQCVPLDAVDCIAGMFMRIKSYPEASYLDFCNLSNSVRLSWQEA